MREPITIILDGATGTPRTVPLTRRRRSRLLKAAGLPPAPPRAKSVGRHEHRCPVRSARTSSTSNGSSTPLTRAILPTFAESDEPFVLVYWSGDPDQTQHAQGDSLNRLVPGINGPTSKAAVQNADRNLKQILDYLDANPTFATTRTCSSRPITDFLPSAAATSTHPDGRRRSYSATLRYKDADGRQEVNDGIPAARLSRNRSRARAGSAALRSGRADRQTNTAADALRKSRSGHRAADGDRSGNAPAARPRLIGGTGRIGMPIDAKVVVARRRSMCLATIA